MRTTSRLSRDQLKKIKKLSLDDLDEYLRELYAEAFRHGLREAEKEFDDPESFVIMDADEAREKIGDEMYARLMGEA